MMLTIYICSTASAVENPLKLLTSKGPLYEQKKDTFEEVKDKSLSEKWNKIRIGKEGDGKLFQKSPKKLAEAYSVVTKGNQLLLTLSNGSQFEHTISKKEKLPQYRLSGAIHLLINDSKKKQQQHFYINDVKIKAGKSHLFYDTLGDKSRLTIIDGNAEVTLSIAKPAPPRKTSGDATTDAKTAPAKPEMVLKTIKLASFDRLILNKKGYQIEKNVDPKKDLIFSYAIVPGFEVPGPYRAAGKAEFKGESLQIKRYGKQSRLKQSPVLLMEGDEVTTADKQTATLHLTEKDMIRLSQNSTFTIESYKFEDKQLNSTFRFAGKIRARIAKRKKRSSLRFKTATAVIGIKGTVFEANASKETTAVETVQGTVGVSDPNGKGEVDVKAGEMTTVAANALPKPPEPIPSDRLKQLQGGGIPLAASAITPLKSLKVLSPVNGKTYTAPVLQLEVEPEDATLIFKLDGQPFIAENGDTLHQLTEGQHQLEMKGQQKDANFQTVSFTIDKTSPALLPAPQLDGLILRQTMPFNLTWSESLSSLIVTYNKNPLPVTLSADGKTSTVDSNPLYANTTSGQQISLEFEARDQPGNSYRFEKAIMVKHKPAGPPAIKIEEGKPLIYLKEARIIPAVSDREIEKWTITLDKKTLAMPLAPQDASKAIDKKTITIQESQFSQLTEGKHLLTVSGADDFGLVGTQTLEIMVDKTRPQLKQPVTLLETVQAPNEIRKLMFSDLVIKEGESVELEWSEPVTSATLTTDGTKKPLPVNSIESKIVTKLAAEQIKQLFGSLKKPTVRFEATDLAGNTLDLQGIVHYLPKPNSLPTVSIKTDTGQVTLKELVIFRVTSDRGIFQWKISLDGKPISLPDAIKKIVGQKQLDLSPGLFPGLGDGKHLLTVSGSDQFNLAGSGSLEFNIDQKGPELIDGSRSIMQFPITIKKDGSLQLKWNEKLSRVDATLEDKPWALIMTADKTDIILKGNPAELSYELKPFTLKAIDLVGNLTQLQGSIGLRKPRTMALEDSFQETILEMTGSSVDDMILTNRPEFNLNNSKPLPNTGGIGLRKEIKFKQKPKSDFFDDLDEPLINSH